MEAPAFPPPPEEAQERLPSNELAEPPLPPQSAPEEPPNGLPTYTHTVGVFELTVVDDVPNAMRRILLPTSNRPLTAEEQDFIFRCFDIPSWTIVVSGAANSLCQKIWRWDYVHARLQDVMHHKIKLFSRQGSGPRPPGRPAKVPPTAVPAVSPSGAVELVERGWRSWLFSSYCDYLELRERCLAYDALPEAERKSTPPPPPELRVLDATGTPSLVNVRTEVLYWVDFSLPSHLPELFYDLFKSFRLETLPGSPLCLHHFTPVEGRPFLGPNMYITPPGSFTFFHEDGFGTVDSGHQSLAGLNEVIMLTRLEHEHQKKVAMDLLKSVKAEYRMDAHPHDDGEKPPWPTETLIQAVRDAGVNLSHFLLLPGEYVHINKGRLHAFRKLRHSDPLTSRLVAQPGMQRWLTAQGLPLDIAQLWERVATPLSHGDLCVSIAWDWQYLGSQARAVEAEATVAVRNLERCRERRKFVLGTPLTTAFHAVDAMNGVNAVAGCGHVFEGTRRVWAEQCDVIRSLPSLCERVQAGSAGEVAAATSAIAAGAPALQRSQVAGSGSASQASLVTLVPPSIPRSAPLPPSLPPPPAQPLPPPLPPSLPPPPKPSAPAFCSTIAEKVSLRKRAAKRCLDGTPSPVPASVPVLPPPPPGLTTPFANPALPFPPAPCPTPVRPPVAPSFSSPSPLPPPPPAGPRKRGRPSLKSLNAAPLVRATVPSAGPASLARLPDICRSGNLSGSDVAAFMAELRAKGKADESTGGLQRLRMLARIPVVDTWVSDEMRLINPYSIDGFQCEICKTDIANAYLHCMGCELLAKKDYNICANCFQHDRWKQNNLGRADAVHMGAPKYSEAKALRGKNCPDRQRSCIICGWCSTCSCQCHTVFQPRFRFKITVKK